MAALLTEICDSNLCRSSSHPTSRVTPAVASNYMQYTDDVCMNQFNIGADPPRPMHAAALAA
jgi:hypothetical protein